MVIVTAYIRKYLSCILVTARSSDSRIDSEDPRLVISTRETGGYARTNLLLQASELSLRLRHTQGPYYRSTFMSYSISGELKTEKCTIYAYQHYTIMLASLVYPQIVCPFNSSSVHSHNLSLNTSFSSFASALSLSVSPTGQ